MHVRKLREATSEAQSGNILGIVMEEGIAHIFLVSKNASKLKAKIEKHISKKKQFSQADKQKNKFFEQIESALETHFDPVQCGPELLKSIKAIIIGSPGSYKD